MKLTHILYGIALISALLMTRTYFMMDRPAEHVDPVEKSLKEIKPETRNTLDKWFNDRQIGGRDVAVEKRLQQWTPTTIENWNHIWEDISYKPGTITGLWFSAGPLHTATQTEKAAIIDYMISKMPIEKDTEKTSRTIIDFSKQLHEFEQRGLLLPVQQEKLNNALASKISLLVEKVEPTGKNPTDLAKALSNLYIQIPESLKTIAGKNLEAAITNKLSTAINSWKPENISEWLTTTTKIFQTVDVLPNSIKKFIFDGYKSMINAYIAKQNQNFNWLNLRNDLRNKEQKKQLGTDLSPQQERAIALTAYASEFQLLDSFLTVAKKLNLTNDSNTITAAKRALRLYKILVDTGTINPSQEKENAITAIIPDQQFIKAHKKQSFKDKKGVVIALPEDNADILFERLNNAQGTLQEITILKEIDTNYSNLLEEKDRKHVKDTVHIVLDDTQKTLKEDLSADSSLGDPSLERENKIKELEAYNELLSQPGIFLADDRALALQNLLKKTIDRTKDRDKKIRDSLEQKIKDVSTKLDATETSILQKTAKFYKDSLQELDAQSDTLSNYSYERFAGNDFRNILKAWVDVIDIAKDVSEYQAQESYKNMQDRFISIQSELNYNQNNAYDNPQAQIPRNFQSRISTMDTQALILSKVSNMIREQRSKTGKESLIALMQLPSNEATKKRLIAEGIYDNKGVITNKGLAVRNLGDFATSVDRRIRQLQYFIQKNPKEPAPLKSTSGISLKLAQSLKLQFMIPDDQASLLQTVYRKIVPNWPAEKDKFIDFMKSTVLTNENILELQEISSIIDLQKRGDLAQLKMPFNDPVFASVVEYTLEIARATDDKDQKIANFFDLYKKYPSLLGFWGINDPKIIVTLDTAQLNTEKITYTNEYQRSIDDSIKAQTSILEKALLDERERKSQFLTGLVVPTFVATYDAVKSKSAPIWARLLFGGIFALGGAIGGALLGGIAGLPGAVGGIATGALLGFTSGAGSGWALGNTIADKLWNWKQKPIDILDDFTGGKASIAIAGGTAAWAAWKMYSAAQTMTPTEAEIESNRAKLIAAGVPPTLRQQNPNLIEKIGDTLSNLFSDEITIQQRTLQKENGNVQQRISDFKKARQQYCDLINEALNLKEPGTLRPTSSYNYFVEVNKKFENEIKKLNRSTRKLLKARVDKAFQLMTVLGRESVRLQFQYANGSAKIIGNLVYTQLLGQAAVDPLSPNFAETLNQGWDKLPKNFRDMFERNYKDLKSEQARKEAAAQDFNTWMDFYNRIFMEHAAFSKMITDKKLELMTPLGDDGQRVYDLYQDMLSGRLDSLMTSYQLTVNEILRNWGRDPIKYAGQKQVTPATA